VTPVCPVCGGQGRSILARPATPVLQNAVYATVGEARAAAVGDLSFQRCQACGFVWNAAFSPERIVYGPEYENNQGLSPAFQQHLTDRAGACAALVAGIGAPAVVEVGCGQGDFLAGLARAVPGVSLRGFDPAWRGVEGEGPAGARITRDLFDEAAVAGGAGPDLIVARHVIEHMPDPCAFLAGLRRCSGGVTRLVVETPDVDWSLSTGAFHDFFYEHCSLFSAAALDRALAGAGFTVTRLERVFGGQYLWAEAVVREAAGSDDFAAYRAYWSQALEAAAAAGPVVVWGAGAKGASFAQLLDADASRIATVVDINPAKQGRYLGGTGHPILPPESAAALSPGTVFVMNPAYAEEIGRYLSENGWAADIIVVQ
jgi:hypothetical protein